MSFDSSSSRPQGQRRRSRSGKGGGGTPARRRLSSFCGPVNSFSKLTKNACAHFACEKFSDLLVVPARGVGAVGAAEGSCWPCLHALNLP